MPGMVPGYVESSAWLLMAVEDARQHGGNSGYDDRPDVYYTWDSTVANHARVRPGDPIAIWDKTRLLGISVIEEIEEQTRDKPIFKCPHCELAGIKSRRTKTPRFKCYKCKNVFDTPQVLTTTVTEYRSRHDAAWTSLENLLSGSQLRRLCASPRSQLSMRALRWDAFQRAIAAEGAEHALERIIRRVPEYAFTHGHRLDVVRIRRGQRQFREHLLEAQDETCAFTGHAPPRVLEAGHLYSYAELGTHHKHGGLLLRRDIHRLFDDGWLAVDPVTLRVDVSDRLESFPQYATLHDVQLRTKIRDRQLEWLARHWAEHRTA